MVAIAKTPRHYTQLPPTGLDPSVPLQLAFNPNLPKIFTLKYEQVIKHPQTRRHMREYLLTDQFGNQWVTYLAFCADDEVHQWPVDRNAYIKPSMMFAHGGRVSADLLDKFRQAAFTIFQRQDIAITAARKAGKGAKITLIDLPAVPDLKAMQKPVYIGTAKAKKP